MTTSEGRLLTKRAIRADAPALKAAFTRRQTAADFTNLVDQTDHAYGAGLITTPQSGFYKEAWLASRFGNYRGATHIWLGEDPPDFYIEVGSATYAYEATEVLRPGRTRDIEMHEVYELGPIADPEENWLTIEENLALIADRVAQKDAKQYLGIDGLLIYLNTGWISSPLDLTAAIETLLMQAAGLSLKTRSFNEIWVACSTLVHRIA